MPEKGSLGTSGDLGPLAAIALVGVGSGRPGWTGRSCPAATPWPRPASSR
nr:aromatic amino acid lyase [Streptomyces sp. NRRL WC-3605]